jgi:hypothetical protein
MKPKKTTKEQIAQARAKARLGTEKVKAAEKVAALAKARAKKAKAAAKAARRRAKAAKKAAKVAKARLVKAREQLTEATNRLASLLPPKKKLVKKAPPAKEPETIEELAAASIPLAATGPGEPA